MFGNAKGYWIATFFDFPAHGIDGILRKGL